MATKKDDNADQEQELLYLQQRRAVNDAYSALQGQANAESFFAFTLEDAVDAQIERIEGIGTPQHPNMLDKTESIRQNLKQAVSQLKQVPPEKFLDVNNTDAVNTPYEDPESDEAIYEQRLQEFQG